MFIFRFFIIELKKIVFSLPKVIFGLLIAVIFIAVILACSTLYINSQGDDLKNSIVVFVPENDRFLNLGINSFEKFESFKDLYKIEKVTDKKLVSEKVENGQAVAGVAFENDLVKKVIKGEKNIPINIYISDQNTYLKNVIMKFADCCLYALKDVQAGIYSAELVYKDVTGDKMSKDDNLEINRRYINSFFSRMNYFETDDNAGISLVKYYGSMLIPLLFVLVSMMIGSSIYNHKKSFFQTIQSNFVSVAFVQHIVLFFLFLFLTLLAIFFMYIFGVNIYFNILPIVFAIFAITAFIGTVFFIGSGNINSGLVLFFLMLIFSFLGGAFVSPSLMPNWIKMIYVYSPVYVWGNQIMAIFQDKFNFFENIYFYLYDIFVCCLCYIGVFAFGRKQ